MLLKYAMQQGWEVYNIYSDDDYAGADRKRPEFNRLLHDAEEGKFDIVLCKTQSRFTRELELVEKYIHGLFPLWGVRFIGLVDNADTDIKGNKKEIFLSVKMFENDKLISERTKVFVVLVLIFVVVRQINAKVMA